VEKMMIESVYEVTGKEDLKIFILWILEINEDECIEKLSKEYNSFGILWNMLSRYNKFTIVIENYYIDRVYRDSFYMYYACKHFEYKRYCKRLFLFRDTFDENIVDIPTEELEKRFMGSIVLRPMKNRAIGRTLLSPVYYLKGAESYLRTTEYKVTMFGKKLHINAFPYSMQDGETTSCAEITILNLLDYFSQNYSGYHYILPSDICKIAEANSFERRLPTTGLRYELITRIFTESGFYPRLYMAEIMTGIKFKRIMHYYVESGIPIALGIDIDSTNRHSIICIGHGKLDKELLGSRITCVYDEQSKNRIWLIDAADIINEYYFMDDNKEPYYTYKWEQTPQNNVFKENDFLLGGYKPSCIMVPLYKRMFLEAVDAYDICTSILADSIIGIQNAYKVKDNNEEIATRDNPLIIRLFMASSRSFKAKRISSFGDKNSKIREIYIETPFPKFVWVCELYTKETYLNQAIGEIVIDATSAPNAKVDSLIILHYPNIISRRMPEDILNGKEVELMVVNEWEPFEYYNQNLQSSTSIE
jgi:hypothetical protein